MHYYTINREFPILAVSERNNVSTSNGLARVEQVGVLGGMLVKDSQILRCTEKFLILHSLICL